VAAPVAARDLGVSPAAIGYYIAIAYAGSMLGSAAAGGWVARFGPIRVSQAGLALCLAGLALAASGWAPLVLLGVAANAPVAGIVARTGYDEALVKRVQHMLYVAEYKRRQAAPGVKITRRNFGRDRRYPITNGFRDARRS